MDMQCTMDMHRISDGRATARQGHSVIRLFALHVSLIPPGRLGAIRMFAGARVRACSACCCASVPLMCTRSICMCMTHEPFCMTRCPEVVHLVVMLLVVVSSRLAPVVLSRPSCTPGASPGARPTHHPWVATPLSSPPSRNACDHAPHTRSCESGLASPFRL